MSFMDNMRNRVQSWLQINPPVASSINLQEFLDWEGNCIRNRIWYRGDGSELEQLYWQLVQFETQRQMFWASHSTPGLEIRKIHTGLPAMIVDIITDIIKSSLNDVNFIEKTKKAEKLWLEIEKDNNFKSIVEKCLTDTLVVGDGAFKISVDKELSTYPIVEYWGGDKVSFRYKRGRLKEVIFKSIHNLESGTYELYEVYGNGYVDYELYRGGEPIELTIDPHFRELTRVEWDSDLMLAVPCMFYHSAKWPGRGQSIFDRKIDAFDAFDETFSQWIDALRTGRTKEYIPENLVPRSKNTGKPMTPNPFDNKFIMTESDMRETAQNKIQVESPQIQHDSYVATYITALELCLLKLLSPSTLGIDVKKLDNAEAQREKEKVTLYTINSIIEALQPTLEKVVETIIKAYFLISGETSSDFSVEVTFQSYANPSFESKIETLAKAKTAGLMSNEAIVGELYGDSRDEEWKAQEIARLNGENNVSQNSEQRAGDANGASTESIEDSTEEDAQRDLRDTEK